MLLKTTDETLGRLTVTHKRKYVKIWDNEIKEVIE